nr:ras-responsive element-binding protein 1 isoform X1 [Helicoverpa armigera]
MQGAATAPAPPAAEPPSTQQIKTEEVISEAKIEADEEMDGVQIEKQELRVTRTTSIDSDNRSDRSEEEDLRRARKRAASTSPSPIPMDKRTARFECPKCRQRFDSVNAFDIHRFTAHSDEAKTGFDDLTFVDFSSKKFPEIARGVCERNPHVSVTEQRYRCDMCCRDFPCGQALEMHRKSCASATRIPTPERDRTREDFFAKLDLKNRSFGIPGTLTPPMERFTPKFDDGHLTNGIRHIDAARDLADIQSILSVTSAGGLLERLTGTRVALESSVLTPPDTITKDRDQEETQDNFAAEFRRMKLRGEFPCRLCPAKFPNLRALKGHNRVHLSGTGPGPYQCNMCPHASLDKAALVRHMRTHNGDRPYECAVCNYAFTTKANCERHLRNRHAKVTREDVKRSIIYHPSEDPNNDEVNSKLARDEVKRSLAFHTPDIDRRNESTGRDTPLTHFTPSFITDRHPVTNLTTKPLPLPLPESPLPLPIPRDSEQPAPRIKVKGIGQLTQIPPEFRPPEISYKQNDISHDSYDEEAPVDLSTSDNNSCDVLDLSKKKRDADAEEPKSTPRPSFEPDPASVAATAFEKTRLLLASQRLFENSLPKIDPAYYASQLSQLYAGAVPGIPGLPLPPSFPIAPYLLQPSFFHHPTDSRELAEIKDHIQKEIIRGLSMSGGRLVPNDPESQPKLEPEEDEQKPPPSVSPVPSPHSESPRPQMNNTLVPQTDSVKMVIKNGVLMPKQKQRRYRTERPFSCSQCSARFTLRSNMERHVKQQHPQHWSVRRPAPRAPPPYPTPDSLTDRMKFALLARHLERPLQQSEHSPVRRDSDEVADNEEDEEDTLVIDEEPEMENKAEDHTAARRAAAEILMATCQQEMTKDFDLKIAGNLINKPVPITNDKTESGTNSVSPIQEPLPVPVVPTRSDEEEDEEGLVASTSEGNNSGSDENKSETDTALPPKKKSAYSLAPNRVSCPYCHRKFPWSSSLRRHVLTHTGQKPFKCPHCTLLFTTKSNCDRHLLRKHGGSARAILAEPIPETVSPPQPVNDTRAVPERPFKCVSCPTSTFSSLDTLKKHMSSRHGADSQPSSPNPEIIEETNEGGLVFKCHLCEASFGDRSGALSHLATGHTAEYEQLVSKGALDAASDRSESADDDERGKFPDHANRKVVCAFCIRRFWSAEDLRRHMRTHSGERPFACDLCRRRFTLKHSMLRHRKKHREEITDDEEASPPNTPLEDTVTNGYRYQDDDGSGSEIPSNVNNNNSPPSAPYEKKLKLDMTSRKYSSEAENDPENSDLIGKLLGIPDKTINKLLSSADEAAKILGVNK